LKLPNEEIHLELPGEFYAAQFYKERYLVDIEQYQNKSSCSVSLDDKATFSAFASFVKNALFIYTVLIIVSILQYSQGFSSFVSL
jgi:hypothetical protein